MMQQVQKKIEKRFKARDPASTDRRQISDFYEYVCCTSCI